eukprot:1919710-Pyramimonas_sp.AAC.1
MFLCRRWLYVRPKHARLPRRILISSSRRSLQGGNKDTTQQLLQCNHLCIASNTVAVARGGALQPSLSLPEPSSALQPSVSLSEGVAAHSVKTTQCNKDNSTAI